MIVKTPENPGRPYCQQIDSAEGVSIAVLLERLGRLSGERMNEVCAAFELAVDCHQEGQGTLYCSLPGGQFLL